MQLECQSCHQLLSLPDDKLPVGRPFSFNCPYCKFKNTTIVPADSPPAEDDWPAPPPAPPEPEPSGSPLPEGYQALGTPPEMGIHAPLPVGQKPPPPGVGISAPPAHRPPDGTGFSLDEANIQSLLLGGIDERPKALVVYDDDSISAMLAEKLEDIGYSAAVAVNLRDAAKQLKFANFVILLVQEDYYGANLHSNHLLKTVQSIDAHTRRNMLVVLISPTMTTLDDLLAFGLSFDAVINSADLDGVDRILLSIIARAKKFYAIYREVLAEHGLD